MIRVALGFARLLVPFLVAITSPTGFAAKFLDPGADISDCWSALRPGPSACATRGIPSTAAHLEDEFSRTESSVSPEGSYAMEAKVDAYLASYGKPPREAVRALLDPTEENIRAYLQAQQQTLSIAAYVAARMSALRSMDQGLGAPQISPSEIALLSQMRVTLFQSAGETRSEKAIQAMRFLAQRVPSLQTTVQLVGGFTSHDLSETLAHLGAFLGVGLAASGRVDPDRLPLLQLEDLRSHARLQVDPSSVSPASLRDALLALRRDRAAIPESLVQTNGESDKRAESRP